MDKNSIITVVVLFLSFSLNAQEKPLSIQETIALAIENNSGLKASYLKVDEANALIGNAFNFDKTSVYYHYDENNLAINNLPLKVFGVSQDFKFPTVYFADKKVNKARFNLEESNYNIKLQTLKKEVSIAFHNLRYAKNKTKTYRLLDSLYQNFAQAAKRRFELGETNYLEMITAQSKEKLLQTHYKQALQEVIMNTEQLKKLVQVESIAIKDEPLNKLEILSVSEMNNLGLQYFETSRSYYKALYQQEKQNLLPDLNLEYFQGTNSSLNTNIKGYQLGVKIPILFSGNTSRIKASKLANDAIEEQQNDYKIKYLAEYNSLLAKLQQYQETINYYETQGENLSKEIIKTAERSFKQGEIDFFQYIQSIENAMEIELTYLENLNNYNQTVIEINYLIL